MKWLYQKGEVIMKKFSGIDNILKDLPNNGSWIRNARIVLTVITAILTIISEFDDDEDIKTQITAGD
jgi:hypothetical protein